MEKKYLVFEERPRVRVQVHDGVSDREMEAGTEPALSAHQTQLNQ